MFTEAVEKTGKDSSELCGLQGHYTDDHHLCTALLETCSKEPLSGEGTSESWRLWGGRPLRGLG